MLNNSHNIAAVIPTFNRASLLGRAIESVLGQTVPPAQLIVVDDGSTDTTAQVCERYGRHLQYVRQENAGASAARNRGIGLSRHPWVAFLDSDDYWTPSHLQAMAEAIASTDGQALMYFSDMQLPEEEGGGTLWQRIGFQPRPPIHMARDASDWVLMKRQPMMLQAAVISKVALDDVGGLNVRFRITEDSHLFCRLGIRGGACAVTNVGCIQTSDDVTTLRLTTAIPIDSTEKTSHDYLTWLELLASESALPAHVRSLVRYNAAAASWGIGRHLLRSGHHLQGSVRLLRALTLEPRLLPWLLRHGTIEGYERTVRPRCAEVTAVVPGAGQPS